MAKLDLTLGFPITAAREETDRHAEDRSFEPGVTAPVVHVEAEVRAPKSGRLLIAKTIQGCC